MNHNSTTEPSPGVRVERSMVPHPAGRRMVATFVKVTGPDVNHDVVDRELRRSRSIAAGRPFAPITVARRPRCQQGRRRGAGRPARRTSRARRTTRAGARSGDSPSGSSEGDGPAPPPRLTRTLILEGGWAR